MTGRNRNCFIFILIAVSLSQACKARNFNARPVNAGAASTVASQKGALTELLTRDAPVIVAHGKSENVASESTWAHLAHSIENGARVLELDSQILVNEQTGKNDARSLKLVSHDPTFHRVSHGYATPQAKIDAFFVENRELAESKKSQWDFNLFDRVSRMRPSELKKKVLLRDEKSGSDFEFLTLDDVLAAMRKEGVFQIPAHLRRKDGQDTELPARAITVTGPLALYIDDKDLVALARRLSGLPNWDWDRDSWSTDKLRTFTREAVLSLAASLEKNDGFDNAFVCVRHPEEGRLVNEIVPRIRLMVSSDEVKPDSSAAEFIAAYSQYKGVRAELMEVKYLKHVLDKQVHEFARAQGWQVFYNQIVETDKSQFEGEYAGNLPRLISRILEVSKDVFLQTNTVPELARVLEAK